MLQTENELHDQLCKVYGLDNMISEPMCFKKPEDTLIDPILFKATYYNIGEVSTVLVWIKLWRDTF